MAVTTVKFLILFSLIVGCTASKRTNRTDPTREKMNCGSLSAIECDMIHGWLVEHQSDTNNIIGVWDTYDKTDNQGENVAFREFKGYCKDAAWTADDCKRKVIEFLKNYEKQVEIEQAQERATNDEKARKAAEKDKLLGY